MGDTIGDTQHDNAYVESCYLTRNQPLSLEHGCLNQLETCERMIGTYLLPLLQIQSQIHNL